MTIYEYQDIGLFLRDLVEFRKKTNPCFSTRQFAKRCQLSASMFSEVISGRHIFSFESANKLAIGLNFDQREKNYLNLLIEMQKVKSSTERERISEQLKTINPMDSLSFSKEIDHLTSQSQVFAQYFYTSKDQKMNRILTLFRDRGNRDFNGFFCDSHIELGTTYSGNSYFLPNSDKTYRVYAATLRNYRPKNPYLQHKKNLKCQVIFKEHYFPTIPEIHISDPNESYQIVGRISFDIDKVVVDGVRLDKESKREVGQSLRSFYRRPS